MDYLMSKQLSDGVCEKCFSFRGICSRPDPAFPKSTIPISYPICASTLHPSLGYCTHTPSKVSAASQRSRQVSKSTKFSSPKKVMVFLGDKMVEQGHFNDYLRQLKQERKEKNG